MNFFNLNNILSKFQGYILLVLEAYLEPTWTSTIKFFVKIVNG